jgi:hypothetical protein
LYLPFLLPIEVYKCENLFPKIKILQQMSNGKCEQEKGEAGTSFGGSAEALYPMYESGLYRNDVGYVKKTNINFCTYVGLS